MLYVPSSKVKGIARLNAHAQLHSNDIKFFFAGDYGEGVLQMLCQVLYYVSEYRRHCDCNIHNILQQRLMKTKG